MNTGPGEIRPVRVVSTKRIIAAAEHRERKSTLPANQRAQLPSVEQLVRHPMDSHVRELIRTRKLEGLSNVVIGKAGVEVPVESGRVGPIGGANGSKVGQLLRPGIVCQKREAVAQALFDSELEAVVIGIDSRIDFIHEAEIRIEAPGLLVVGCRLTRNINSGICLKQACFLITSAVKMVALVTDIGGSDQPGSADLALQRQVPERDDGQAEALVEDLIERHRAFRDPRGPLFPLVDSAKLNRY